MDNLDTFTDISLTLDDDGCLSLKDVETDELIWELCSSFSLPGSPTSAPVISNLTESESMEDEIDEDEIVIDNDAAKTDEKNAEWKSMLELWWLWLLIVLAVLILCALCSCLRKLILNYEEAKYLASLNERNLSTLGMETTQNVGRCDDEGVQVDENTEGVQVETIEIENFEVVTSRNSPRSVASNSVFDIEEEEVEESEDEMDQIQNWLSGSNDTKTMGTLGDGENKSVEMGAI